MRWKIEQFHREFKQLTGIEKNQCRKARIQRNHIACAMLVWLRLTDIARTTGQTFYRIKHGVLDDYLLENAAKISSGKGASKSSGTTSFPAKMPIRFLGTVGCVAETNLV